MKLSKKKNRKVGTHGYLLISKFIVVRTKASFNLGFDGAGALAVRGQVVSIRLQNMSSLLAHNYFCLRKLLASFALSLIKKMETGAFIKSLSD